MTLPAIAAEGGNGITSSADITSQLVQINSNVIGKMYHPAESGPRSKIGFLIMHSNSDFLNHIGAENLASRGYQVLAANTRYTNQGDSAIIWDNVILDVKAAADYLRKQPGIEKVILLGHSGGGPTMAYYQNLAENGVKIAQGHEKLDPAINNLDGMKPADAVVFLDSHLGYGVNSLSVMDPSVLVEGQSWPVDDGLNMYSPDNGYDLKNPTYTKEWEQRFFQGQSSRMNRLIDIAQNRLKRVENGKGDYLDNEPFMIPRQASRLWLVDLNLLSHTKQPHTLLTKNGPVETIVKSVRLPAINKNGQFEGEKNNLSYDSSLKSDLRSFLSTHAIRTTDDFAIKEDVINGIDYNSSNTATPANLEGVHVPLLLMSMTGHYWVVPNEINFNHAASEDKSLVYVEGATHGIKPLKPEYGDTVKETFDYVATWIDTRFVK